MVLQHAGKRQKTKILIDVITLEGTMASSSTLRVLNDLPRDKWSLEVRETKVGEEEIEDVMESLGIETLPVILVNGKVSFVGNPTKRQILDKISSVLEHEKDSYSYYM